MGRAPWSGDVSRLRAGGTANNPTLANNPGLARSAEVRRFPAGGGNPVNGLGNGGASGDAMSRYRAAVEQARGRNGLGSAQANGALRTRSDLGAMSDRFRARTQASTPGTTSDGATTLRRTADGAAGGPTSAAGDAGAPA